MHSRVRSMSASASCAILATWWRPLMCGMICSEVERVG